MAFFAPTRRPADLPAPLSIHDPIHIGTDPFGQPVELHLTGRHLLVAGEPGSGKSVGLTSVLGHAALSPDVDLTLLDAKDLELPFWASLADQVVGRDIPAAIEVLARLEADMIETSERLKAAGLRKLPRAWRRRHRLVVIDELAMYLTVFGTPDERKEFLRLLLSLVATGRAAGIMVLAAAQRPSADVVPTKLRDLFQYRWALRCVNADSSDIILGQGWASKGYDAGELDPAVQGVGYLLADGGLPRVLRAPYLSDDDIRHVVAAGHAVRAQYGLAVA
jgi:S-DNA-T family DNA segregation ATPase FtsK/SpoIIIE